MLTAILICAILCVLAAPPSHAQVAMGAFWKPRQNYCICPNKQRIPMGKTCADGGVCAGKFLGKRYMIMPSGCDNTTNPTCTYGIDEAPSLRWKSSQGNTDIPDVETVTDSIAPSTVLGDANTTAIANYPDIPSNSAASTCENLVYAGYDDWYLPSKSELVYIFCNSNLNLGTSPENPQEKPSCGGIYGNSQKLGGFRSDNYSTSTEQNATRAWALNFETGRLEALSKAFPAGVRCIRRY